MDTKIQVEDVLRFLASDWDQCSNYVVENLYLFGSRVHGVQTASSDYDFIVLVSGVRYSLVPTQE
jgi:predicted nucleotidyltransferase